MGLPRYTRAPWHIEPSDLRESESGYWSRDVVMSFTGRRERQYALHITGSVRPDLSLGLLAIRCERVGSLVRPLTLSIPENVPVPGAGE